MFERFTDRARRVLVLAQEEARLLNHNFIGTEHILLGLISEGEGMAAEALESLGIALESVRERVRETIGPASGPPSGSPPFTPRAKTVLELSLREAIQLGHNHIGTEHMLLGLVRESEGVAAQVLIALGVDLSRVRQQVIDILSSHEEEQSGAGASPPQDHLAAVDADQVTPADVAVAPGQLVTWEDAEAALRSGLTVFSEFTTQREARGVRYRTSIFQPRTPPTISISVAHAEVTRAAFDAFVSRLGADQRIDGLGDAATFNPATGSLRVLTGSTLFVVSVQHHEDPLACASALARKALERLGEGPPQHAVS